MCEEILIEEKDLDTHLKTCETCEYSNCLKRIQNLSDIKKHIEGHQDDYTTLNHLRIDRESEFDVKINSYNLKEV